MSYLLSSIIFIVYYLERLGFGGVLRRSIYLILFYIIGYRTQIVIKNLKIILPHIKIDEIEKYKKSYYNHLADLIVETLWCYKATREELDHKVSFKNPDLIDQIFKSGDNISILLSHIGNWELFCQWAGKFTPQFRVPILYTPIKNKMLNASLSYLRERTGNTLVSTKSTLDLYRLQRGKPAAINLFAIDQNPGDPDHQHWLSFFGQKVPVISGAEKFVKSQSQKAYFLYVTKKENYEIELIELSYDKEIPFDLTEKQFKMLEANILENPSIWLLSHNRFKYSKHV